MHEGHRKRMMERLQEGGQLQDHELLEILLFNAIPRKNTNEIAHALLEEFGSIDAVMHAEASELMRVKGVGASTAAYLRCTALLNERIHDERRPAPPKVSNFSQFKEYLSGRFRGLDAEVIDVFCLDAQERVTSVKRYTTGVELRARVRVDELGRFLVARKPVGLLVVHNHPIGTSDPSDEDDVFTAQLQMYCSMHKVFLRDHIIIAENGIYSYFRSGRLQSIKNSFDITKVLSDKRIL